MQNQAMKRSPSLGGRGQDDGLDDLARYVGDDDGRGHQQHAGDPYAAYDEFGRPVQEEQPYDPRAYAPNPDEPYAYDEDGRPLYYEAEPLQKQANRSGFVLVGAVLALAALGGAGAMAYKMLGGSDGAPPLIKADVEPVKTVPEKPGGAEVPHQNKAIYDRVDGAAPPKSTVVSREEEPVELPSGKPTEPHSDGARVILPGGPAATAPTAPGTMGAEPRRVKTTTIRPDAAFGQNEDGPTASTDPIAEAARSGAAPRGSEFDNGIMAEPAAAAAARPRPAAPAPASQQAAAPRPQAPAPAPTQVQAPRPAQPVAAPQQQVAAVAPRAPGPAAATPARSATGGFVVQVTSQRSEQEARAAYGSLQKRFPQVLGSYQASIQTATVGDRGTYYRVRVGPFSSSTDASTVCNNLRAAGGDCVVSRN
jgi:cell division septation protein DedD